MITLVLLLQTALAPDRAQVPVQGQRPDSARAATVGDTLWLTRTVQISPGQTVHAGAWQPPDPIEAVGVPRVTVHGTTVELVYQVTVWRAGEHRIEIPGPLVLGPGSKVDSLPPYDTTVAIRSVLPAAPPDSTIAPQPPAGYVPRRVTSWWPLAVLWALAAVLLVPLHWWWRRRGKPVPVTPPASGSVDLPIERWAAAGEHRTVITLGVARLRAALDEAPDRVADPAVDELLAALDRARFGTQTADDALALYRRAAEAGERLSRGERRERTGERIGERGGERFNEPAS